MGKIIVFDFDKTLTNYDTTFPFFLFCCKKNPLRYLFIPMFFLIKLLSKYRFISVKKEKEIGLKLFCPYEFKKFKFYCRQFAQRIVLNNIYFKFFKKFASDEGNNIIVASASFQYYLEELFPNAVIIGTTVGFNEKGRIIGINQHPFGKDKAEVLKYKGLNKIDIFFTDSKNDIPTSELSNKTKWVKKGKIVYS